MTSIFRTKIAQRVVSTIEDSVSRNCFADGPQTVSPLLKVKRTGRNVPQLQLPWHKLVNLNPMLEESFKPANFLKAIRSQGLPNTDGVTNISFDNTEPHSIVFTLDGHIFTKAVLMDICVNLDVMAFKSCNFHNIIPKNVLVEYSSPKLGKPLDMTYFRSAIHGNFIANINRFVGHKVTHINLIEDWGLPYALLVAGYEEFGQENQLERNPNFHLSQVLKAAHQKSELNVEFSKKAKLYYKKMVEGDARIVSILKKLRDPCIKQFKEVYKLLGIEFDDIHYDSMHSAEIAGIEEELIEKQLLDTNHSSESSLSEKLGSENRGEFYSPTYSIARNVSAALYRKNRHNFDEMFYVANASEKKQFASSISILEALGYDWYRNVHHVKLADGISFRSGKNKKPSIDEVLHAAKIYVLKDIRENFVPEFEGDIDDIAGLLSNSSLMVYDMYNRKNRSYSFDLHEALQVTKKSGISLQLCHAALTELIERADIPVKFDANTSPLTQAEALMLVRHLSRFDEIVYKAYYTLEPCIILQYLETLSYLVEKAVAALSVSLKENRLTVVKARVLLFHATRKVLQKGLELLGIRPLERF